MKKRMRIIALIIGIFLLIPLGVSAEAQNVYHWYCKRNKEHRQPQAAPELSFVEEYQAYYVDRKHGDTTEEKVVYLTFDVGYENGNVQKILDCLKRENVQGAFFVLGHVITSNTDLIKRMLADGHLVCNHTYSHKDMTKLDAQQFEKELKALEEIYTQYIGEKISPYYRPPEGKFSLDNIKWANRLGYKTVFWSFAYADWDNNKQPSLDYAKEKILSNIHNGAVLLLHPTSETNAAILGEVIQELKHQGYRFGTLDELTA